jgi:hypothetical protein
MGTGAYAPDAWYWPITLNATNKTLQIEEDAGACIITITLEEQDWYLGDDESLHATYPQLLYAIRYLTAQATGVYAGFGSVAVTGTKTNAYTWSVSTPTSSTSVTNAGLTLTGFNAVTADDFIIDVSDSTLDMRHLGSLTAAPSDPTSTGAGTTKTWASPGCLLGRWVPYNHAGAPCAASRKRPVPRKIVDYSSPNPADAQANEWYVGTDRTIEYRWQMPGHVHETRADETGYATQSGLAAGDKNNAFYHVWDKLTAAKPILLVHNTTANFQVDANEYEVVKLARPTEWEDMVLSVSDPADLYQISVPVAVVAGTYPH